MCMELFCNTLLRLKGPLRAMFRWYDDSNNYSSSELLYSLISASIYGGIRNTQFRMFTRYWLHYKLLWSQNFIVWNRSWKSWDIKIGLAMERISNNTSDNSQRKTHVGTYRHIHCAFVCRSQVCALLRQTKDQLMYLQVPSCLSTQYIYAHVAALRRW